VNDTVAPDALDEARRRRPGPSVKPALVVVGIAALLLLLFGIGSAVTGSHGATPAPPGRVAHSALPAEPARVALRPIERAGTPPPDVLSSLVVPKGAATSSATRWDGETQYSAKMAFRLGASQAAIVQFYRTELRARGWSIVSVGAAHDAPRSTEVLAQRASSDGWYWEVGAVVSPTTFGTSSNVESTSFSLELFEEPDPL
jgi:hypothetical protein